VRAEGELGAEHCLALQPCALADEQVVVVAQEWHFLHIKDLVPQI